MLSVVAIKMNYCRHVCSTSKTIVTTMGREDCIMWEKFESVQTLVASTKYFNLNMSKENDQIHNCLKFIWKTINILFYGSLFPTYARKHARTQHTKWNLVVKMCSVHLRTASQFLNIRTFFCITVESSFGCVLSEKTLSSNRQDRTSG